MEYQDAKNIRKKSFGTLLGEQEGGLGTSLKKTLSLKSQARMTGIKETFDPMNLAKKATFGSNWAPAMMGKMLGRDQKSMEYFTGAKFKKGSTTPIDDVESGSTSEPVKLLGLIYKELLQAQEYKKLQQQEENNKKEEKIAEESSRDEQLIEAVTGRKPRSRAQKKAERRKRRKEEKKKEEVTKEKPKGKGKGKEEKPKETKKETTKTTEKVTTKETTKAPKTTEKVPSKEVTAPKGPESVPTKAPSIPTAAKIASSAAIVGTAGLAGKEALATNIAKYESTAAGGYNAYNRGTIGNKMLGSDKPIDFSKMTISEYLKHGSLKSGDPDKIFAVGRYQIIPSTMKDLIKTLKIDPDKTYLDPATQDSLFANGLVGMRRKKVDAYVKGRSDDRNGAILELAQEFASIGVPYDMPVGKKQLKKGDSYYSGIGGNKAHNSPEEVGAALDADRAKNLQSAGKASTVPPVATTGSQIDKSSKENKDLKESSNKDKATNTLNNTTNVQQTNNVSKEKTDQPDDTNPYLKKVRT
jgi:hypothetical protein